MCVAGIYAYIYASHDERERTLNRKTIVEVKNLCKSYDKLEAVKSISFDVYEGEIFGLLGPNGAGKTTTLEILETLRPKSSGSVWIDGISLDENPNAIKRRIGVQLQESGYYPNLTLVEVCRLLAGLYQSDADPLALLKRVDLVDKAHVRVDKLSGGQKQRFSIATTLIHKPRVVFLDEPTVGLDPQARRNAWELIRTIRAEGATVVMTTHYLDEAELLCDRVGIIDEGKIIALDAPHTLIDHLLAGGFRREKPVREATLEDVFLHFTGKELREDA